MKEVKFKVGDLVKRRGSGETGVVLELYVNCTNPDHVTGFQCLGDGFRDCRPGPTGTYKVSLGFDRCVDAVECELRPSEHPG